MPNELREEPCGLSMVVCIGGLNIQAFKFHNYSQLLWLPVGLVCSILVVLCAVGDKKVALDEAQLYGTSEVVTDKQQDNRIKSRMFVL